MRARCLWNALIVLTLALGGCAASSSSTGDDDNLGVCVTDFSCGLNEECSGGACGPIKPALRSHIQTASCVLRAPVDDAEVTWRSSHFDVLIAGIRPDLSRAVNPNVRLFEYVLTRFNRFDRPAPKTAMQWAAANGYDGEDFYLHYREDTNVPTWEGKTIVPGYTAGMVPGWNPAGGGNPASATSRDHSRVVGYYYGPDPWHFGNLAHPGYRAFLRHHIAGLIDGTWWLNQKYSSGPIDGVLIDDAIWYPQFGEGLLDHSTEYYGVAVDNNHPYTFEIENLFPRLASEMLDEFAETKEIMPNYGHVLFLNYPNRCAENIQDTAPWIWGEVWVSYTGTSSPTSGSNRCISEDNDYGNLRQIIRQTREGKRRIVGARDTAFGMAGTDRGKLLTLGLYYLIHNRHTYYMYETIVGHMDPNHVSQWAWNPAIDYDVGQPDVIPQGMVDFDGRPNTREHYVFATGPDPGSGNALAYRVYARRFTNALVLAKLMPIGSTTGDTSITTHALDGTYTPLQADGTVGPPITQASIRNNEALILIPVN